MNKVRFYLLHGGIIGLTLISLTAGFAFYVALFGLATAVLCSVVFETIRVACLWSLTFRWLPNVAVLPIYGLIATTCALAAVTSFHAQIIESHRRARQPAQQVIDKNITIIKSAFAKRSLSELKVLTSKRDVCARKLAWNAESRYWQNRLAQLSVQTDSVIARRNVFLQSFPDQPDAKWLIDQAAILGIDIELLPNDLNETSATISAVRELWGINEVTVKKVVSVIIVMAVEIAIFLLAMVVADQEPQQQDRKRTHSPLEKLCQQHQPVQVFRFLNKCKASLAKHNRLPLSSELGKAQRAMRKKIGKDIDQTNIEGMIKQLKNNKFGLEGYK